MRRLITILNQQQTSENSQQGLIDILKKVQDALERQSSQITMLMNMIIQQNKIIEAIRLFVKMP